MTTVYKSGKWPPILSLCLSCCAMCQRDGDMNYLITKFHRPVFVVTVSRAVHAISAWIGLSIGKHVGYHASQRHAMLVRDRPAVQPGRACNANTVSNTAQRKIASFAPHVRSEPRTVWSAPDGPWLQTAQERSGDAHVYVYPLLPQENEPASTHTHNYMITMILLGQHFIR